ncbi:MAG: DUF1080 domain-containing protein [Gemmatimonadetes bacterium]|nr:DUF1080 domain-containing protein [Gemmatimonadota bacterium]
MRRTPLLVGQLFLVGLSLGQVAIGSSQNPTAPSIWRRHDLNRTRPPAITPPGPTVSAPAPSDAIVLFNGRDLSAFTRASGAPAAWKVENGYMEVAARTGSIRTKESFGDMQLHLEWASPNPPNGVGQDRGNSGVIIMGQYEVQVLDSYQRADTYADGQAASLYGQYPPLVNATRPPGEWQSYDILFRRPRFRPDGTVQEPARITVMHNGILVQNNEVLFGPTAPVPPYRYVAHADELPFTLQDHSHPVRFRNIWVRKIQERPEPAPGYIPSPVTLTDAQMMRVLGAYYRAPAATATPAQVAAAQQVPAFVITREGPQFWVTMGNAAPLKAFPTTESQIYVPDRGAFVNFTATAAGGQMEAALDGSTARATRR